jgi:hypothetical protein
MSVDRCSGIGLAFLVVAPAASDAAEVYFTGVEAAGI